MTCCEFNPKAISWDQALHLTSEGKKAYFKAACVAHPRIKSTMEVVQSLTSPGTGARIVFLIGPTGVGKTALVRSLAERYRREYAKEMEADRGFIPFGAVEAPGSGVNKFAWRELYRLMGAALCEPLMDRKQETLRLDGRTQVRNAAHGSTVAAMGVAVRQALLHRRTKLFVIDEAVHMTRERKTTPLPAVMDALKTLANIDNYCEQIHPGQELTLVLVGSYDLVPLMELSGQLARRTEIVHFTRYGLDDSDDRMAFQKTIRSLQKHIPMEGVPDLAMHSEMLHLACMGCVGILKDTLMTALGLALKAGKWEPHHLELAILSPAKLKVILKENLAGETLLERSGYMNRSFATLEAMHRKVTAEHQSILQRAIS